MKNFIYAIGIIKGGKIKKKENVMEMENRN